MMENYNIIAKGYYSRLAANKHGNIVESTTIPLKTQFHQICWNNETDQRNTNSNWSLPILNEWRNIFQQQIGKYLNHSKEMPINLPNKLYLPPNEPI